MTRSIHYFVNYTMNVTLKPLVDWAKLKWSTLNDFWLNINTTEDQPVRRSLIDDGSHLKGDFSDKAAHYDNNYYESPDYVYVRRIARSFINPENEVFYDIGCGKGRILCVMAQKPFKRVVGIDLFEGLCEDARANAGRLRGRKAPITIRCEDAAKADISDGTVYFMFNPFGPATMQDVLENMRQSLVTRPRQITIIYYNAAHANILRSSGWLAEVNQFLTATGRCVSFWRNTGQQTTGGHDNSNVNTSGAVRKAG